MKKRMSLTLKLKERMVIKLKRYYGDAEVTKSVMEVWLDGEQEPRLVCEARETAYVNYAETFPGASRYCLPVGRWKMKAGGSPYSPMGLRVPRCPGHRQVFVGWKWARQWMEGEVLIGESQVPLCCPEGGMKPCGQDEEEMRQRRIENGEEVFGRLDALVYEAFGKGEEMWLEVEDPLCPADCPSSARALASVASDSATFSCPVSSLATPVEGEAMRGVGEE